MTISIQRPLPQELADVQKQMSSKAREYGLDFFETIFEVVDYDEMSMLAAFGGFPVRYPHWRFGAEYDELSKGYEYGLQKIYEMVINTNPCYAYLLKSNSMMDQKLVIAHVYGHSDFFKNNAWFKPTNRRMLDEMANHAARVNRYIDRIGHEEVEAFIDACLSLEDLVDPHSPHIRRRDEHAAPVGSPIHKEDNETPETPGRFASKDYMDDFINPREALEKAQQDQDDKQKKKEQQRNFPPEPERDVLLFLLEHAPLKPWQHDILQIVRDEAYYFAPQGQTKIMNEGWASFWHSTIMTTFGLTDGEVIDYADHHSGTMAMSANRLNPYKIGIELYRDIEERWDKGQFGSAWEECDDVEDKKRWDKQLGLGREKIFEVRRVHNDVTFIDAFLTPEFCYKHKLFSFAFNDSNDTYEIASRQFQQIKQQLLTSLANHGRPFIYVTDGNYKNRGELYLLHKYQGAELKHDYCRDTLSNLQRIWGRPVHIETVMDDRPSVISFDGTNHDIKQA
ncbi:MAG: SpoVR family protein [Planctomycetia bacterium]|nr:SpoVR family protein [Planctomycetia bacterium]